mgnify:CR=1 FL=1
MSNTNNHDGLIWWLRFDGYNLQYDQYHDQYRAKAASKLPVTFPYWKCHLRNNDDDEQYKQPTMANK